MWTYFKQGEQHAWLPLDLPLECQVLSHFQELTAELYRVFKSWNSCKLLHILSQLRLRYEFSKSWIGVSQECSKSDAELPKRSSRVTKSCLRVHYEYTRVSQSQPRVTRSLSGVTMSYPRVVQSLSRVRQELIIIGAKREHKTLSCSAWAPPFEWHSGSDHVTRCNSWTTLGELLVNSWLTLGELLETLGNSGPLLEHSAILSTNSWTTRRTLDNSW